MASQVPVPFDSYNPPAAPGKVEWDHPADPIVLTVGKRLPIDPNLAGRERHRAFWRLSYEGGSAYKFGNDASGQPVFVAHEAEGKESQDRRRRLSCYRNYCKPIVNRYNNLVFSSGAVSRDGSSDQYNEFLADADLLGTDMQDLMRHLSLLASIEGESFAVLESTKAEDANLSVAESRAIGTRMFVIPLKACRILRARMDGPKLIEALVSFPDEQQGENTVARLYKADSVEVALVDKRNMVVSITSLPNDFGSIQCVRVVSESDASSMLKDIAELNKSVFNLDAIHREELVRQTFTSWLATGVRKDDIEVAMAGGRKIHCVSKADQVGVHKLSADVQQAQSLRDAIKDDVSEIYRLAGLSRPQVETGPESGRALKIRFEEIEARARAIADQSEKSESSLTQLWNVGMNEEIAAPEYPESFLPEDIIGEIEKVQLMKNAGFSKVLIQKAITRIAQEMFDLDEAEAMKLATELSEEPKPAQEPVAASQGL
jgi:hypothetical protein